MFNGNIESDINLSRKLTASRIYFSHLLRQSSCDLLVRFLIIILKSS